MQLDQVKVQREADGNSKGYGFVEFKNPEVAENAMKHLNGFELANQPIRVNYVNERTADMESLDTQDMDVGVGMTATSRASLMAKLSEGHKAGGCGVVWRGGVHVGVSVICSSIRTDCSWSPTTNWPQHHIFMLGPSEHV